jgi:hypothetical protein
MSRHDPLLRLDRRGRYSVPTSEQAASGRLGSLELRHRAGSILHAAGGRQHPQSPDRPVLQHRPPAAPRMVQGGSREVGSGPPRTRRHHLFCTVVGLDPQELAVPAGGLGAGYDKPRRPAHRLVFEFGLLIGDN